MDMLAATIDKRLNATVRGLAREIIDHFAEKANLRVSTDDPLEELRYIEQLLEQKAKLDAIKPQTCPNCAAQLEPIAIVNEVPIFRCANCHGIEAKNEVVGSRKRRKA